MAVVVVVVVAATEGGDKREVYNAPLEHLTPSCEPSTSKEAFNRTGER